MKKLTSILAAALAIAGCQPAVDDPAQPYRDAMPAKESVQLGAPAAEGTAAPTALFAGKATPTLTADVTYETVPPPAYPDQSAFATVSYWSAVGINGGTWWTLTLVKLVTSFPATTCDDQSCTWGPWLGDDGLNNWKLEVSKLNGTFDWVFLAQNAIVPGDWVSLISGHAIPGLDKHHGKGSFVINFDAQAALAHGPGWNVSRRDYGNLTITYDNTGGISVDAVAIGGHSSDPADGGANPATADVINAAYSFSKNGPGGTITIGVDNVTDNKNIKLDTHWNGTGAGRGDAIFFDGVNTSSILTECWDGAAASWAEVYDNYDSMVGTPDLCAFDVGDPAGMSLPPR